MILVDANLLLYAVDADSPFNERATRWLTEQLGGVHRIGLARATLVAFLRISTSGRVFRNPLTIDEAWQCVHDWRGCPQVWIAEPTDRHEALLESLTRKHHLSGDLVADAHLAALALEHGLTVVSADSDFARFPEVRWLNPLVA